MTIDLMSIALYFIENVDLVGATHEHLKVISNGCKEADSWRTIIALARVSPATTKEPGC